MRKKEKVTCLLDKKITGCTICSDSSLTGTFQRFQTGPGEEKPKSFELKLVEPSDVHGAISPNDFINDRESKTSLVQVLTYVDSLRAVPDQEVILLDNGDRLQGQPIVYYYNFEETEKTHIQTQVINYMGYV